MSTGARTGVANLPLGCSVSSEAWAEEGAPLESSISPNEA